VALCSAWLDAVLALVAPRLVMPIGSLALGRFLPGHRLDDAVGRLFDASEASIEVPGEISASLPLLLPLPHPSGQSRWLNDPARARQLDGALSRLAHLIRWAESG
jgi:uracil-DNA glycosylase